ncbi:hypothetical protein [Pseudonocardia autotrophica]|nr:hypothetical protein [Pseudonocardia autotrophica]BBG01577.1 hypothetical protein Pdca_27860 [Pseudonocardia autotrophica]
MSVAQFARLTGGASSMQAPVRMEFVAALILLADTTVEVAS